MNVKATEQVAQLFENFGVLYFLPPPEAKYIEAIQAELSEQKWGVARLKEALDMLKYSKEYNDSARFGRYPTIYEIMDADWEAHKGI